MRNLAQPVGRVHQPEVIDLVSDSEDDMDLEESGPEIIVISDSDEVDALEEPEQEELDILPDLEDGELEEIGDIPTVANQVRIGFWSGGYWRTPGNWRNYARHEGGIWSLNEPPMDGVEGGLRPGWEQNLGTDTLGGLLYTQWLQNADTEVSEQVTLDGSIYNAWLESTNNTE